MSKPTTRARDWSMRRRATERKRRRIIAVRWRKAAARFGLTTDEATPEELAALRYERQSIEAKAARAAYQAEQERERQRLLDLKPSYTPLVDEMRARMSRLVHPDDAAQDAHVRQVLGA